MTNFGSGQYGYQIYGFHLDCILSRKTKKSIRFELKGYLGDIHIITIFNTNISKAN